MYNTFPLPVVHNNTYNQIHHSGHSLTSLSPIGIFDSGVGGLSVAIEIAQYLPNEQILYFADTANVPYGAKSDQEIRDLTARAIEWLYRQGCKLVVVACNSASAFSLDYLRNFYGDKLPIIGLVPALKPAVISTKTKVVAVLATPATFRGKPIQTIKQHFADPAGVEVLPITCLDLVPFVEQGLQMSQQCLSTLERILTPAVKKGADCLVLGCTHYPFLKPAIEYVFGQQLTLIDSGLAVARHTAKTLIKHQIHNQLSAEEYQMHACRMMCYVSGNNVEYLTPVVQQLLPHHLSWKLLNMVS